MKAKDHRWNLLVPLALLVGFASSVIADYEPNTFLHGDGSFYATMNRSLLDGTLVQRGYQPASWYEDKLGWNHHIDPGWSNIAVGKDGTWYPKHPTLMPILATPLFALLGYDGLLLFNLLALVAGLWGAFRLAARWAPPRVAAVTVLAMATLPIFTRNAYAYSNDVLYGALVVWGYDLFFRKRVGWAGLLLGLSIWAKATNGVLGLPLGLALLVQRRWRDAAWMAGMTALPVLVNLGMNAAMFGSPLVSAYNRVLVMEGGKQAISDVKDSFGRGFWPGVQALWSDPHEGFRTNALLLLPSLAGLAPLARRAPLLTAALAWGLPVYFALFIPYEYTYARFFLPWALLLMAPMAVLVARGLDGLDWAWERWGRDLAARRHALTAAVAVVALITVGAAVARRTPPSPWRAADHVTEAKVLRGEGRAAKRCDYFNLRHMKWECAMLDRDVWQRWGLAVGKECRFDRMAGAKAGQPRGFDAGDDWLWMHPNPGVARSLTLTPPPGRLLVRYGLAKKSRFSNVKLLLDAGPSKRPQTLNVHGVGQIHELTLPADQRGASLTFTVPEQPHDWRHLCVAVRVLP